jgi:hypothetical protein
VIDPASATRPTPISFAIDCWTIRKIVKSKASSTHPDHAAMNAAHCPRVGSFHHGIGCFVVMTGLVSQVCVAMQ